MTLQEFIDPRTRPAYAILSHRWGLEEVLFDDMQNIDRTMTMAGMRKILGCCAQARRDGYEWGWIDTCCIDKRSSAELSEAINSMYAWYSNSGVCYAYLDDVDSDEDPEDPHSKFRRSLWFTRGWTLQELLAPTRVVFFAKDWTDIGTRQSLTNVIEQTTDIDREVLWRLPLKVSVARRMSWAAHRDTTREEDRAYSLMGLFNVNMPMIYGEGKRAFVRLQHEIMKQTNDHSMFAWSRVGHNLGMSEGLLASSPSLFASARAAMIIQTPYEDFAERFLISNPVPEHMVTNYGVRLRLPLKRYDEGTGTYLAALACSIGPPQGGGQKTVGIVLRKREGTLNQYLRDTDTLVLLNDDDVRSFVASRNVEDVYVEQDVEESSDLHRVSLPSTFVFTLNTGMLSQFGLSMVGLAPPHLWSPLGDTALRLQMPATEMLCCGSALFRDSATDELFAVVIGIDTVWGWKERRVWGDVFIKEGQDTNGLWSSKTDTETALRIYYVYQDPWSSWRTGDIASRRSRCLDRVVKVIAPEKAVKVKITPIRSEQDQEAYTVDVVVARLAFSAGESAPA